MIKDKFIYEYGSTSQTETPKTPEDKILPATLVTAVSKKNAESDKFYDENIEKAAADIKQASDGGLFKTVIILKGGAIARRKVSEKLKEQGYTVRDTADALFVSW